MTTKEFQIRTNCQAAVLEQMVNSGWSIHFMQFMPDATLNAVFVRDCKPATPAPTQPFVGRVMDMDQPKVVALTNNRFKIGDTRPIHNPMRADVQARREQDRAELIGIAERLKAAQAEIDRNFIPFQLGVKS